MDLSYWQFQVTLVTLAWIGGFLPLFLGRRRHWTWLQAVGLALVLAPFLRMGILMTESFTALVQTTFSGGHVVLEPYPEVALWRKVWRHFFHYFLVPGTGLLLLWQFQPTRDRLREVGLHTREGLRRDTLHGFALFFVILVAYLGAMVLAYGILGDVLASTGDESRLWIHLTPTLVVLLAGVAGLAEEFLFRGLLLAWLAKRMPWAAAAVAQAVFFGLVHSGYMTWAHVLGPLAFGLGMAVVARVLGIVPAMLLHAEINIAFFALQIVGSRPEAWILLAALVALNVWAAYLTRFSALRDLWRWLTARVRNPRASPPEPTTE